MHILLMIAVVAVFWTAGGTSNPLPDAPRRLAIVVANVGAVSLMAWALAFAVRRKLYHDASTRCTTLRRYRRARSVHLALLLSLFAWTLYGLHWAQLVRANWGLEHAVLLDELLILAPLLVPLAVSWAAFYEVDRAMRQLVANLSGRPLPVRPRFHYVDYHFRHSLGLVLVPVLFVSAAIDLLSLRFPAATAEGLGAMLALAAVVLGFPLFLRVLWKAKPLPPGPLRDRLESISRRAGFHTRDILVWDTGGTVANAVVAGFLPALRYVMLSDGLVENFSPTEVEAVFGHEVGHIKHRHVPLRLISMLPLFALLAMIPQQSVSHWKQGAEALTLMACQLTVMGAYVLVVFGYFCRRLERQADLFACRVNSCGRAECSSHSDPNAPDARPDLPVQLCPWSIRTFTRMLERLADFNGLSRKAPSWQHFSIARRIRFLESLLADPTAELQFQRALRRTIALLAVTVTVVFACAGWTFLN